MLQGPAARHGLVMAAHIEVGPEMSMCGSSTEDGGGVVCSGVGYVTVDG